MKETMKNAMKKLQESKKIVKESYSFQEIIDMMEEADTYSELNSAAEYINDPKLREEVMKEIEVCREDGDEVAVAYSVVTSDLLDCMVNEVNESKIIEAKIPTTWNKIDTITGKTDFNSVISDDAEKYGFYQGEIVFDGQKLPKSGTTVKVDIYDVPEENWDEYGMDEDNHYYAKLVKESKITEARDRIAETISKFIYDLGDEAWSYTGEAFNNLGQKLYTVNKNGVEKIDHNEVAKAVLEEYPELLVMLDVGNCIVFGKRDELNKMEKEPEVEESLKENITLVNSNGVKFDEKELRKNWEEELKNDLEDGESLEEYKKKVPFEKWIENLLDTGDYKKLEESEVITEKYPADGTYTEEERDAYYERTKKRVQEYADNLDLTPLFNWLKEITGINDLTFEVKKDTDAGKPRLNWESNNIVDKIGVMKFAFKDVRLESFGNGVTTTAPDYYDSEVIDFNKDYDVYYWCSVHFGYEHIDGGTNGASIGKAVCKEGKWEFSLDKERYKNR